MAKISSIAIVNPAGEQVREEKLSDGVISRAVKPAVVHQVVVGYAANRRGANAHTKTRDEVSGGGKKPWRQKGTGRARQGSTRSPQWVGGGTVFGPRNTRNYGHRLTDELKNQARAMVIADYLTSGRVVVVESFPTDEKTKPFALMLKNLKVPARSRCLVLLTTEEVERRRGLKNIAGVTTMAVKNFNAYDGLQFRKWVVSTKGLGELMKLAA